MKVLLAPDKFKGSLTGLEVAEAMAEGVKSYDERAEVILHPLADGGEGTLEALQGVLHTTTISVVVHDPIFREIEACYLLSDQKAFIEMARASGLPLLTEEERSATRSTTLGTGEMVRDAIHRGAKEIYLMIGGSATNDLGMGMAQALGYRFLDSAGYELQPTGSQMIRVAKIKTGGIVPLKDVSVTVICDVQNLLFGPEGAAHVYARQKGATDEEIEALDQGLRHLSQVISQDLSVNIAQLPGAGAAGGIGGGAVAFLGAQLKPGIDAVMEMTSFERQVEVADLIITGEGKLDIQTLQGKVVDGVRRMAQAHKVPYAVVCGVSELSGAQLTQLGAADIRQLMAPDMTVGEAISRAAELTTQRTIESMRAMYGS